MTTSRLLLFLAGLVLTLAPCALQADSAKKSDPSAPAVVTATVRQAVINDLSEGDEKKAVVIPNNAVAAKPGTAQWHLERANLCLFASGVAKDKRNSARLKLLNAEAERSFATARASGQLPAKAQAQCSLNLGTLAERRADVATAAAYYAESLRADPGNTQAAGALKRAQEILAFRESLKTSRPAR